MTIDTGLRLVTDDNLEAAHLAQQQRELRLTLLQVAIGAMDTVFESLPDSSAACIWMAEALELVGRVHRSIDP